MKLREHLEDGYGAYAYAYPHKTAYRALEPARRLAEVWRDEDTSQLFLYVHVPFCEMRCGFCNLFTYVGSQEEEHRAYVDAVARQAQAVAAALPRRRFARLAFGGGTPTFLEAAELARLFAIAAGLGAEGVPSSVEVSPATADEERLAVLRSHAVQRVSIGVQSFVADECRALGRPQRPEDAHAALRRIRRGGFPMLNVDLIYGVEGQTEESWRYSLTEALSVEPEEIYLYPLYVRALTGLGRRDRRPTAHRRHLYRVGRDHLLAAGYEQGSMRMFRRPGTETSDGPAYCCQRDGMVGLGAGARSYTRRLHYASEYAVARRGVKGIVAGFVEREDHDLVDHGFELDEEEAQRRFVLQSLLQREGMDLAMFEADFGCDAFAALPQLDELLEEGLAVREGGRLVLRDEGLAASDAIGPWLVSERVARRMGEHALR